MTPDPDPTTRTAVTALGLYQLLLGAWMAVAPGSFHRVVAPFGPRNDHDLRDMATWELALAGVALTAARRPAWRVPVLAVAALHFALHALNHLLDVGDADPGWVGPADLAVLAAGAVLLVLALRRAGRVAA